MRKAEKYLDAAWRLSERAEVADHLAQAYNKEGKHADAIHLWRLALAADSKNEAARTQLQKTGALLLESAAPSRQAAKLFVSPAEELGKLRTFKVPRLASAKLSAEYYLLLSRKGIEDARLVTSRDDRRDLAADAIREAKPDFDFPDSGPEKILRQGILFCSKYTTPSCSFIMLLPSGVLSEQARAKAPAVQSATLLAKVQPEYTKAALDAKAEGTVTLWIYIDEAGVPHNPSVVKPLGFGLDEEAKACVLKWRFNAKLVNGKPVGGDANVEVNFRLR